MKLRSLKILVTLLIAIISTSSFGQYDLLLKFGNVNAQENLSNYLGSFNSDQLSITQGRYYKIVQFYNIPTSSEKELMINSGMEFLDYIPNKAYIVSFPSDFDVNQLMSFDIRSIIDIVPEYKQAPVILDKQYPSWAKRPNNEIAVIVNYYTNVDYQFAANSIESIISKSIQHDKIASYQICQVKISDLDEIINLPFVSYVEPHYPPGEPENYTGKTLHQSNVLDSDYDAGRHFDGTGVNVMLQDDGYIGPHIDYEGRIGFQYINSNFGDHGDHCAGTIFGAGNIDPKTTGMAPGATLYTYGAAPDYPGFNLIPSHYTSNEIRISSTSYSNGCNAGYTSLARTMDIQVNNYPALMHVFSAGNSGTSNCGYGAGAGWGNVTGGHKIGKNVIATANLDYKDALSNSSSRGPAHDGRIKPDISAKGSSVYSTQDPNTYTTKSGTSMACPGIAGSLAQLYQAYKELNSGEDPKGGLMKAIILNTAEDLGNPGPDFKYGWGRIKNLKAVMVLEENRYFSDEISQGQNNSHQIYIPEGTKLAKIMVYWTDKEASVGTNKALVNDINITLTDPSNIDHYPWLLSHYPNADSLNKPAGKGIDYLNNMEQVSIEDPEEGTYTLNTDGFEIPFGPQEYFVVYEFIMDEIIVTYPNGGESFESGNSVTVRWDAYGVEDNFSVDYSIDNGVSWTNANDNISGSSRYYNWNMPSIITGEAKIRVSRNGLSSMSEEKFSIMEEVQNMDFERSCPNSVLINWDPVDDAVSYDVYMLGEKYMEIVGSTTADSIFIGDVNSEEEHWFSVRAIGPNNAIGPRSIAELKPTGIWNCQFNKDLAVSDILSPPRGILYDCQDYSDASVKIEISNLGLETLDNISVHFQFENEPAVYEAYPGSIEPGENVIYQFEENISLNETGIYNLTVWILQADDENTFNNTIEAVMNLKSEQTVPNFELTHFDDFAICGYDPDCEDFECYIDNKWYNLQNNVDDHIDWRLLNGITPTANTGPIGDHTSGTIDGNFLYLEASGECYNKAAILMSPCIDLGDLSNPGMEFWYNMHGTDMGKLHIDVISQGELFKDVVEPIIGDQGSGWNQGIVNLSQYVGEIINIRLRGQTGDGELSDLAIDDITITEMTSIKINTDKNSNKLVVYPNPSSGIFNISYTEDIQQGAYLQVVDLTGRLIYQSALSVSSTSNSIFQLKLPKVEKGIYYLVIKNGDSTAEKKLIKY